MLVHNRYQSPGGEDSAVAAEASLLRAREHRVSEYMDTNARIAGLSGLRAAAHAIWSHDTFQRLSAQLRDVRPEVVHFHNTFMMISPAAYYACKRRGLPVVQTLHNYRLICPEPNLFRAGAPCEQCVGRRFAWPGVLHACYRDDRKASLASAALVSAHRALGTYDRQVDVFVALSNFSRSRFVAGGLAAERVLVGYNCVFPDPGFRPRPGDYAVFAGRLCTEKGVDTLLEAFAQHSAGLPLKIAGDGPLADVVRKAAARQPWIEYLGQLPRSKVIELVAGAAFTLVPSLTYENCSMAVLESLAVGTPVVASNIGSFPELLEPGVHGELFEPGQPASLRSAIERLQTLDPARIRKQARAWFERNFSADPYYRRMLEIFAHSREANAS
jgi:glycosyltransferase involved in cell wall biosynthesis